MADFQSISFQMWQSPRKVVDPPRFLLEVFPSAPACALQLQLHCRTPPILIRTNTAPILNQSKAKPEYIIICGLHAQHTVSHCTVIQEYCFNTLLSTPASAPWVWEQDIYQCPLGASNSDPSTSDDIVRLKPLLISNTRSPWKAGRRLPLLFYQSKYFTMIILHQW